MKYVCTVGCPGGECSGDANDKNALPKRCPWGKRLKTNWKPKRKPRKPRKGGEIKMRHQATGGDGSMMNIKKGIRK